MDRGAILSRTRLFSGLPAGDIAELAAASRERRDPKGAFIFREGDPANAMFIVAGGQVKIGRIGQRGDEVVFTVVQPGETFGELALLEDDPVRSADAQTMDASECLVLGKDAFLRFLEQHPSAMRRLLHLLMGYLRDTDATISETAFLDIPGRVARKLLELAAANGDKVEGGVRLRLRLSQRTLAGMVGASRENVNRALSRFEKQGLIRQDEGRITVLQRERLRRLC